MSLKQALNNRLLILDGAMGSLIQQKGPTESDHRGGRLKDHPVNLKGNHEILNLHKPDIIYDIHSDFYKAGADIVTTNTLNGNYFSQKEYQTESLCYEINLEAGRIACKAAKKFSSGDKPRFVAGSIGPTSKSLTISNATGKSDNQLFSFDHLVKVYKEQISGLFDGEVDFLLIETIFDTLNTKAAIYAAKKVFIEKGSELPVMISATVSGKSGRLLSGQTVAAFYHSVKHADPLAVGLNCSFGAKDLQPFVEELSKEASCFISFYPNAGIPDHDGNYTQTPQQMAKDVEAVLQNTNINIIGGCCGTTPEHIEAFSELASKYKPVKPTTKKPYTILSGLEPLEIKPDDKQVYIGERTNVAGSKKFSNLIESKNYVEALNIAQQQVENGAQLIDICMDLAEIDSQSAMREFLLQVNTHPLLAKIPVMIDSSDFQTIITGLKCVQGKSIVNSISLKGGEKDFIDKALEIQHLGAAVVVMLFDEKGQADTTERRIEITKRSYKLLTGKAGIKPEDIIFDPNVMAIGTGNEGSNNQAISFLETCNYIKNNLPCCNITGGISNLSFAFRGANKPRQTINHIFLKAAQAEGLKLPIINPAETKVDDFPKELLKLADDIVFNKNPKAIDEILNYIDSKSTKKTKETKTSWRYLSVEGRLKHALVSGIDEYLEKDIDEAAKQFDDAYMIIENIFMPAMEDFSKQFDKGTIFLPQVVRSASIFQKAVKIIQPYLVKSGTDAKKAKGKVVLATVEGDVHDIGKNIASVIFECNGFEVIDMGVMVPASEIVETAKKNKAGIVGLSGLITPSLQEMVKVAELMEKENLKARLIIGGATTSEKHTKNHIATKYSAPVNHVKDASKIGAILKN